MLHCLRHTYAHTRFETYTLGTLFEPHLERDVPRQCHALGRIPGSGITYPAVVGATCWLDGRLETKEISTREEHRQVHLLSHEFETASVQSSHVLATSSAAALDLL